MKAVCWNGVEDIRVETVADPQIVNQSDIVLEITSTAICGSDLHLYDGYIASMKPSDILGHEFMGEVVEVGSDVRKLRVGDRVIVPFDIACGHCYYCEHAMFSLCDNSNPNSKMAEKLYGFSPAGMFGYSHMFGGYAGGQAEYVRVPFADVGPLKVPEYLSDEQILFLTDIFPTGYMAAENANIQPGDTVAIWGCGPVGQFAIASAFLLGAERVIAIDRFPERLNMARENKAEIINYEEQDDVVEILKQKTGGRGPDSCIDAVGMEAHSAGIMGIYDHVKQTLRMETDRPHALREAIQACRKGGTISIPGVYAWVIDKMPIGTAFSKGLTFHMGQTHVQRYTELLLQRVINGDIDPSFVISHRLPLDEAPEAYRMFRDERDSCTKVVLKP
jgi:threonine dehydrogenase-like Zn-dependent dehydrogenase